MVVYSSCLFWFSLHPWSCLLCSVLQISLFSWSSLFLFCSFVSSVGSVGRHSSRIVFTQLVPGSPDYSIIYVVLFDFWRPVFCTHGSPGFLQYTWLPRWFVLCWFCELSHLLFFSCLFWILWFSCYCLALVFVWGLPDFPDRLVFFIAVLITSRVIYRWTGGLSLSPLLRNTQFANRPAEFLHACFTLSLFILFILQRIIKIFII